MVLALEGGNLLQQRLIGQSVAHDRGTQLEGRLCERERVRVSERERERERERESTVSVASCYAGPPCQPTVTVCISRMADRDDVHVRHERGAARIVGRDDHADERLASVLARK